MDYFIKMKITNLSGKKVILIPGDNDPASGMPINANVIAMITKDVPVVEPSVPALQFAVVDAETRQQFLLINGSQLITLRPVRNKNVIPINLIIAKPSKSLAYLDYYFCQTCAVEVDRLTLLWTENSTKHVTGRWDFCRAWFSSLSIAAFALEHLTDICPIN